MTTTTVATESVLESPRLRTLRALQSWLEAGRWRVGDQLPPEPELARDVGVSRGTLRVALKRLETQGWLEATRGAGRVVIKTPPAATAALSGTVIFARIPGPEVADHESLIEHGITQQFLQSRVHVLSVNILNCEPDDLSRLVDHQPLGVVTMHRVGETERGTGALHALADMGCRVVAMGDSPALQRFDRVVSDHEAGGYEVTRNLLARGVTRVARLTDADPAVYYWAAARRRGYERAMAEASLEPLPDIRIDERMPPGVASPAEFEKLTRRIAGCLVPHIHGVDRVGGFLLDTDLQAFYVAGAVRLFKLEPGRDVLIAGYDNYWNTSPLRRFETSPPCVTVDKREKQMGQAMVQMLLDRLRGEGNGPRKTLVTPELVNINRDATLVGSA
jgi:DNA-binding LacI/PurR family transcriptional regulator